MKERDRLLLCLDIGNTNITLGVFRGDEPALVARIATDADRTADQYAAEFSQLLSLRGVAPGQIDGCIISNVVPPLNTVTQSAVHGLCGVKALLLGPGVKTGLNIRIDNPAQLGADLVAAAVAVVHGFPLPAVVYDLGTATKISAIDEAGSFLGCSISAGLKISLEAMATRTAQLPYIGLEPPARAIGRSSVDSMKSGLIFGAAAMLEGITARMEAEMGEAVSLIATGGFAHEVVQCMRRPVLERPNLVLEGLRIIYEKNVTF